MKKAVSLLLVFSLLFSSMQQAQANAVTVAQAAINAGPSFSSAISGAVSNVAVAGGVAANDARIAATVSGMSKVAANAAIFAGSAAAVGTAPAWGTILAVTAAAAAVTYAVNFGLNKLDTYLFGNNTISKRSKDLNNYYVGVQGQMVGLISRPFTVGHMEDVIASGSFCYGSNNAYWFTMVEYGWSDGVGYGGQVRCLSGSPAVSPVPPSTPSNPNPANLPADDLAAPVPAKFIADAANDLWKQAALIPGYIGLPYPDIGTPAISPGDVPSVLIPPAGDVFSPPAFSPSNPLPVPAPVAPHAIPPGTINPATGLPFPIDSTGQPVAPPGTVDPATGVPYPVDSNGAPIVPAASAPVPVPAPTPSAPKPDLGPDPGIGMPTLEDPPTAAVILKPIFDLLPDFRHINLPSHASTCPAPSFVFLGSTFLINGHCLILADANVSSVLSSVMTAAWSIAAAIIVLMA